MPETYHTMARVDCMRYGPLTRYAKLRIAHAPETFSPPPTSKETTGERSRNASWHVRDRTCRDASRGR